MYNKSQCLQSPYRLHNYDNENKEKYHTKNPKAKYICKKAEDYNTYLTGVKDREAHKARKKLRKVKLQMEFAEEQSDRAMHKMDQEIKKMEKQVKLNKVLENKHLPALKKMFEKKLKK